VFLTGSSIDSKYVTKCDEVTIAQGLGGMDVIRDLGESFDLVGDLQDVSGSGEPLQVGLV